MHILFVAEYYFANRDFVQLSTELAKRKHSVSVATSFRSFDRQNPYSGVEMFEINPPVTIHSIPHSLSFPFSKILRLTREREIEVVHALADYSTNSAVASFVSKITGIPFVYTVQGIGTRTSRFVVDALAECYDWTIERFISRNAKKHILLSKNLISRTRKLGVPDSKVVVIPSGIDCIHFDSSRPEVRRKAVELRADFGISEDVIVVGFVGRLVRAKGLTYLLASMKQIGRELPEVALLFVGDGPQKAVLQSKAKQLNLKTVFTGYQNDTRPYYALMDVFALPSFFEGLPVVVLEAMAMKKPVVATNVGGTSDLVLDGQNGFLVPPKDAERLASALKRLIKDEGLRAKMGNVSRGMVQKNFLWGSIVSKVETVYKEVV